MKETTVGDMFEKYVRMHATTASVSGGAGAKMRNCIYALACIQIRHKENQAHNQNCFSSRLRNSF